MTTVLRDVQRAMMAEIAAKDGAGLYRKLVRQGVGTALSALLPRTRAHLGERWDRDVTRFLDEARPISHYLRDSAFELVAHVSAAWRADPEMPPYIDDLARYELLRLTADNAPDDPPAPAAFELTLDRGVVLSCSARCARFAFAVHVLPEPPDTPAPAEEPTQLCLYRDADFEVRTLSLTPSAAEIVERLAAGAPLGEAVSGAAAARGVALDEPFLQGAASLLEDLVARGVVRGLMGPPARDG